MPQEQFWRVKHKQQPSPESSEEDRDSAVTVCTGNNAIRNQEHDAGKDLRKAVVRIINEAARDQEDNGDVGGSRTPQK